MQGHGSTCDCAFSVWLHIALCMCIALFVCLPAGAFCFVHTPEFEWGPPFSVVDPDLPMSTVYCQILCSPPSPPALDSSPFFVQ